MIGVSRYTGKALGDLAHLKQSIIDILTTPIGTRIMQRDYGSRLFELVDKPINDDLRIQIYAATAEALALWEPRFRCERVSITNSENGKIELLLDGEYLPNAEIVKFDGITV